MATGQAASAQTCLQHSGFSEPCAQGSAACSQLVPLRGEDRYELPRFRIMEARCLSWLFFYVGLNLK